MFVRRPALSAASRSDWPLTSFSSRQRHARNTFGHIDVVAANAGIGEPDRARFLDLRKGPDGEPTVSRAGIPCSQPGVFPVSSDKGIVVQKPTMPTASVNFTGAAYSELSCSEPLRSLRFLAHPLAFLAGTVKEMR